MEIDPKDPKALVGAILIIAGAIGGGSMLGLTVEPESTTQMRIERAQLTERASHLENQVYELKIRVDLLEDLVSDCRRVIVSSRVAIHNGEEE